jgi:hypothetical protein
MTTKETHMSETEHEVVDNDEFPGRWICKQADCGQPVEANPPLYLSLTDDGTWCVEGVGDNAVQARCTEGHPQDNLVLEQSLSAFLEEQFPGSTWAGSGPRWQEEFNLPPAPH